MKMIKYYLVLAIVLAILSRFAVYWPLQLLLLWTSTSLLVVSGAYVFNYPSLFRKREDGSIPWYIRWAFVPFLLGSYLYNRWQRQHDDVPPIQKITDNVFVAARLSGADMDKLDELNIQAILDVTAEFDGLDWSAQENTLSYLNIPVLDHTSPTREQLTSAINWITQQHQANRKVVVHCALGRGRSVLVVAAYLLSQNPSLSVTEALKDINTVRKTARLNRQQLRALGQLKRDGALSVLPPLTLIANPVSGGGKWHQEKALILANLNPYFNVDISETTESITAAQLAEDALQTGAEIIVACGGDGTINEVASKLVGTETSLGIIPLGTANALSQVLYGIGSKLTPIETACQTIQAGHTDKVDVAYCNDELMLMVAAIGFEQQMIAHADRDEKNSGGQFAYLQGLWNAMENNHTFSFEVAFNDEPAKRITTPSFVIANAAPLTTALAQGGDLPDMRDGQLDLTWLSPMDNAAEPLISLAELFVQAPEHKQQSERIHHHTAAKVVLRFDEETGYALDGELRKAQQMTIEVRPGQLNLICDPDQS